MNFIIMPLIASMLLLIAIFISTTQVPVYAHISKTLGNFTVEVGWSNEPPLVGEINNAVIQVNKGNENNSTPVRNALSEIYVLVKYGGVTKTLDFKPSEQSAGLYQAEMIPTRLGSYSLVLNGTLQGQSIINAEIPLDDVESKQKLSFPDSGNLGESTNTNTLASSIGTEVERILSQLANDIDVINDDINTLAKNDANMEKSFQDVKKTADRSYLVAITGMGVGVAGIIIAAVAFSRKSS
ncbi:MAG: hypothetical protein M3250_06435 [Thermoproteota archaeon]|nr:hypothetical protein [Thermoproteota archaeon]